VLSQREPRDAAVNFDTYRISQRHRAFSLPQHGFLVGLCDNAGLLFKVSEEVATEIAKKCRRQPHCCLTPPLIRIMDVLHYLQSNFSVGSVKRIFSVTVRIGRSRSSKVINFGRNRKRVCDFLLVLHSNLGPIWHRFKDIAGFLHPTPIPP